MRGQLQRDRMNWYRFYMSDWYDTGYQAKASGFQADDIQGETNLPAGYEFYQSLQLISCALSDSDDHLLFPGKVAKVDLNDVLRVTTNNHDPTLKIATDRRSTEERMQRNTTQPLVDNTNLI